MKITWYGTASVGFDDGKTKLLLDPFVRQNKKLAGTSTDAKGFTGADAILVTHGHIDHILDIPEILKYDKKVIVYCTKTAYETLCKNGASPDRLHLIQVRDTLTIGDFTVRVHRGKHVDYDSGYVKMVFFRCVYMCLKLFPFYAKNLMMPLKDDIVIYEIENGGKSALLMGSFGFRTDVDYPVNPDVFVLPFGGSSVIPEIAKPFMDKVQPKKVIFDHFDDAFPPLTKRMDVESYGARLEKEYPGLQCIVPIEKKAIEI